MSNIYTSKSGKKIKKNKWTSNRGHQECLKWQQLDYFLLSCYYTVITVLAESWLLWMKNHQSAQSKTVTGSSKNPRRRLRPLKSGLETWTDFQCDNTKLKCVVALCGFFKKKNVFFDVLQSLCDDCVLVWGLIKGESSWGAARAARGRLKENYHRNETWIIWRCSNVKRCKTYFPFTFYHVAFRINRKKFHPFLFFWVQLQIWWQFKGTFFNINGCIFVRQCW